MSEKPKVISEYDAHLQMERDINNWHAQMEANAAERELAGCGIIVLAVIIFIGGGALTVHFHSGLLAALISFGSIGLGFFGLLKASGQLD